MKTSVLAGAAMLLWISGDASAQTPSETRRIDFYTSQATWSSVTASPDGRWLFFPVLGDLFKVSTAGGTAELVLGGPEWIEDPVISPDGRWIAYVSDKGGLPDVWIVPVSGGTARRITALPETAFTRPVWLPDSKCLVAVAADMKPTVFSIEGDAGTVQRCGVGSAVIEYVPETQAFDGVEQNRFVGLGEYDAASGAIRLLTPNASLSESSRSGRRRLEMTFPDNRARLEVRDGDGPSRFVSDLGFVYEPFRWEYTTQRKSILHPPRAALSADERSAYVFKSGNLTRFDLETGAGVRLPLSVHIERDLPIPPAPTLALGDDVRIRQYETPSRASNGDIIFAAAGRVWRSAPGGLSVQIGEGDHNRFMPAVNPTGGSIAYVEWTGTGASQIFVESLETGERAQITPSGIYGNPTWSADGRRLAYWSTDAGRAPGGAKANLLVRDFGVSGTQDQVIGSIASLPLAAIWRSFPPLTFSETGDEIYYGEFTSLAVRVWAVSTQSAPRLLKSMEGGTLAFDASVPRPLHSLDNVTVDPTGKNLVLSGMTGLWLLAMDQPVAAAARIEPSGAEFVSWTSGHGFIFSAANRVATYDLASGEVVDLSPAPLTLPRLRQNGIVAYVHAGVVTMDEASFIRDGLVVVENGRFSYVGEFDPTKVPEDAATIDLSGRFMFPGLIDVHAHNLSNRWGDVFPVRVPSFVDRLRTGVTTLFDPAGYQERFNLVLGEFIETGRAEGPRIYSAGKPLSDQFLAIPTYEDALAIVRQERDAGAIMVKSYARNSRTERQWLNDAARELGVRVTVEGSADLPISLTAIEDGATAVEHELKTQAFEDVVEFFGVTQTHLTTTLVKGQAGLTGQEMFEEFERSHRPWYKPGRGDPIRNSLAGLRPEDVSSYAPAILGSDIAEMARAGAIVSAGAHGEINADGLQLELRLQTMAGLTPWEALQAGTINGARKLGLDGDLGSISVGKIADFVVSGGNPLLDIAEASDIQFVVKNGFCYSTAGDALDGCIDLDARAAELPAKAL